jgi:hypothetical protein
MQPLVGSLWIRHVPAHFFAESEIFLPLLGTLGGAWNAWREWVAGRLLAGRILGIGIPRFPASPLPRFAASPIRRFPDSLIP